MIAESHFNSRMMKIGMFSFRKNLIMGVMHKSIREKQDTKSKNEAWENWQCMYLQKLSEKQLMTDHHIASNSSSIESPKKEILITQPEDEFEHFN